MLFTSKTSFFYIGAILIVHQSGFVCSGDIPKSKHDTVPINKYQTPADGIESRSRILSRKRRFLSFPEGSSYQVVMDQTIPIVSKTLIHSVGITIALAWQLPTISLFTMAKLLREKTATAGAFRRNDENLNSTTLIKTSASRYNGSASNSYRNMTAYDNSYDPRGDDISLWQNAQQRGFLTEDLPLNFLSPFNWTRHDWGSLVSRYLQSWIRKHPPNFQGKQFYPVFGKRSIDEHTHPEEKFFLDHHRSTRHELYLQIEKFLEAKGKHGHHCVLRALCESGQRKNDNEPKPFLKSIMKAVFSMPTTHEMSSHHKHRMYDEAHSHVGRCVEKFPLCQDSIWSGNFLF